VTVSLLGEYRPGRSPVHRLPAGVKLLALVGLAVLLVWWSAWWQVGLVLLVVLGLYAVAALNAQTAWVQVRTLLWVVLVVAAFQWAVAGWRTAASVSLTVITLVLAAGLITATTTTTALTEVVVALLRPLRRFGVAPERVALLVSLSIRAVAVVAALAQEVRDAQRARGRAASPRAFVVPLLVRSLRHAQRLGEALVARGFDD
jgi:biotin transport system permease protein